MAAGYPRTQAIISLESVGNDITLAFEMLKNLNPSQVSKSIIKGVERNE